MTTNIKLFENWLAEEGDAVETPPAVDATAAATTLTTTVKPAVAAKAVPTKFEAGDTIGDKVSVRATLLSPETPFNITKSTLTVNISHPGGFISINSTYGKTGGTDPNFGLDRLGMDNYKAAETILFTCRAEASTKAKRSLSAILYQVLGQAGITKPDADGLLDNQDFHNRNMYGLMIAAGLTSYRGGGTLTLTTTPKVVEYLKSLIIYSQVNIDTRQLTGKYAYTFSYIKFGDTSVQNSITNFNDLRPQNIVSVQPTEDPSSLIVDPIAKAVGMAGPNTTATAFRAGLLSIIKNNIKTIQTRAQTPVA